MSIKFPSGKQQNEILCKTGNFMDNIVETYSSSKFKYWLVLLEMQTSVFTLELFFFAAIIGGGIGGTSCAYFLREIFKDLAKIDVYEGNKVGGRLATVVMNDGNEYETGGSIIHQRNKYMSDFVTNLGKACHLPLFKLII